MTELIEPLQLPRPDEGIFAFNTTRGKAERGKPYSEWNLCDYVGDDALCVLNARLTLCAQLGIELDHLVMPRQTHSLRVAVIDEDYLAADFAEQESRLDGVDALVTSLRGVCIGVNTADCVPVVLADEQAGVIAVAHSGWRGTVGRIAAATVQAMKRLGGDPVRIQAAMGPSICQDCFEVGDEVVDAFAKARHDLAAISHRNPDTGKAHIHLREAIRLTLLQTGVAANGIAIDAHCTHCHPDRYFSARRMGTNSGRTFTGIMMKP